MSEKDIEQKRLEIAKKLNISVKNPRYFEGHDGVGINVNIYIGSRMIATGYDDARGGCMDICAVGSTKENREVLQKLESDIHAEPQYTDEYGTWNHNLEDLVNALVVKYEEDKEKRKNDKKGIVYKTEGGLRIASWQNMTIPQLIKKRSNHMSIIQKRYDEVKQSGVEIMNLDYLKSIGVQI